MVIDQRNAGASVTPTSGQYTVDRWSMVISAASKLSFQQNAGSVTPPTGFSNYLGITSTSAYSVTSGDYFAIYQGIEGYNIADLNWGTANAKTITLSFWVRSSLTGTFGGSLNNGSRSYPFTYSISSANTWTQASVTIAGDTSGTYNSTNGTGVQVWFGLGVGSTYSGTANSWATANYFSATGATSVVGTNGATFYITGVQLEKGSTATSFDYRPYGTELALCQRYYEKSFDTNTAATSANASAGAYGLYTSSGSAGGLTTAYLDGHAPYRVEKRTNPTVTCFDQAGNSGVCTRISPGVAATSNQAWGYASQGTSGFIASSTNGSSAGRLAFYWMSSAEL